MIGITKQQQLKYNAPLKQKPIKEPKFLAWMHNQNFGCMVCGNPQIELHHTKEHSTDLKDDRSVLPLCELHHKYSDTLSPHGAPKKWREAYPIELQRMVAGTYYERYCDETN